jgi:hypothetical protein
MSHSEGLTHQFKNQKPMPSLFYLYIFEPNGQSPFADRKPQTTRAKAGGKHWVGSYTYILFTKSELVQCSNG